MEGLYRIVDNHPKPDFLTVLREGAPVSIRLSEAETNTACLSWGGEKYKGVILEGTGNHMKIRLPDKNGVDRMYSLESTNGTVVVRGDDGLGFPDSVSLVASKNLSDLLLVRYRLDTFTAGECRWVWDDVSAVEDKPAECWVEGDARICRWKLFPSNFDLAAPVTESAFHATYHSEGVFDLKALSIYTDFSGAPFTAGHSLRGNVTYIAETYDGGPCLRTATGKLRVVRTIHDREACSLSPPGISPY